MTKEETDLIIAEQNKSTEEILKAIEQEKCELLGIIQGKDKAIKDLEKENAELKETLKTYNGCGDWDNDFHTCRVYLQHEELQMYIDQLTKAKEIIREIMKYDIPTLDYEKAQQFLKEI